MLLSADDIRTTLYETGKIDEALAAIEVALITEPPDDERNQLIGRRAWCRYRQEKYDEALDDIEQAGDEPSALRCRVYIRAYSPNHRNDGEMEEIVTQLGRDIDAFNALVIRARDPDCNVSHAYVWSLAEIFLEEADTTARDVKVANLLHNVGHFYIDKARNRRDFMIAIGTLTAALAHYGEVSHWHHRAAACFWMSRALDQIAAPGAALQFAMASAQLWLNQLELDPGSARNKQRAEDAAARVAMLLDKCQLAIII